jgi:hypothetical protein
LIAARSALVLQALLRPGNALGGPCPSLAEPFNMPKNAQFAIPAPLAPHAAGRLCRVAKNGPPGGNQASRLVPRRFKPLTSPARRM